MPIKKYQCKKCKKRFETRWQLGGHMRSHWSNNNTAEINIVYDKDTNMIAIKDMKGIGFVGADTIARGVFILMIGTDCKTRVNRKTHQIDLKLDTRIGRQKHVRKMAKNKK